MVRTFRSIAWPFLIAGLSSPFLANCSSTANDLTCNEFQAGANLQTSLSSLDAKLVTELQATADLELAANNLRFEAARECSAIASELQAHTKADPNDPNVASEVMWKANEQNSNPPTDDQVKQACAVASARINNIINGSAGGMLTVSATIQGGQCSADFHAQATCEGQCKVSASCDAGTLETRCQPGHLSGQCSGMCMGAVSCAATATQPTVDCSGMCNATCEAGTTTGGCDGTCEGTCDGNASNNQAAGSCAGTCTGTCTKPKATAVCTGKCHGECQVMGNANVNCGANAMCKGQCSAWVMPPTCDVYVTPPSCQVDSNCEASCQSSVQAKATCTPPTIAYQITGGAGANMEAITALTTTLQNHIPKLYNVAFVQGKLVVDTFATTAKDFPAALGAVGSAGTKAIACGVAAVSSFKASANVSVSIQASAQASTSAKAGNPNQTM